MVEIKKIAKTLEDIKKSDDDDPAYWYARDLYEILGYVRWENFITAIEKAKQSCQTSGFAVKDHFRDVTKMVNIGSGSQRSISDYRLTKYACYLIAQNGNTKIPEIAFAQMYFAIQTEKQELISDQIEEIERLIARKQLADTDKEFAGTVLSRDVDQGGLAEIISIGDYVLFGSNSTKDMKRKLMIRSKGRALADFLPTITLKAKDLAAEATTFNAKIKDLRGKELIKAEHIKSNRSARNFLLDLEIVPEELHPSEDIKKVERRHAKQIKIATKNPGLLEQNDDNEELVIEIPAGTTREKLLELNTLFLDTPGKGRIILKFSDRKVLINPKVNITKELSLKVMSLLELS